MDRVRLIGIKQIAVLSCVAVAFISAGLRGPSGHAGSHSSSRLVAADASLTKAAVKQPRKVILVVGDSLIAQSTAALEAQSTDKIEVKVAARLGTAPCDWTGGAFDAALAADHPSIVVFAFAGNAGAARSCIGYGIPKAYSLAALLQNYQDSLTQLANDANNSGATVIFSDPPGRNPAVPAPPAVPTAQERLHLSAYYGFQGVPQIRSMYADLANTSGGTWHLSDAGALAVSPNFHYTATLACDSDDGPCPSGYVTVRAGGTDAIHLDPEGHGAKRLAKALVDSVVLNTDPVVVSGA